MKLSNAEKKFLSRCRSKTLSAAPMWFFNHADRNKIIYLGCGFFHVLILPQGQIWSSETRRNLDMRAVSLTIASELLEQQDILSAPQLKFLRKLANLTQKQCAELLCDVSNSHISRWEKPNSRTTIPFGANLLFRAGIAEVLKLQEASDSFQKSVLRKWSQGLGEEFHDTLVKKFHRN